MRPKFANRIDMTFAYTPAAKTDVSKTIKREQKRLAAESAARAANQAEIAAEAAAKVAPIRKGKA